jgi:macrolide-specific efflux system membrane fusion protein
LDNLKVSQNIGSTEPTTAQLQLQIAQANYDQAVKNLDGAVIQAPVSGDVASISTAVGGNVGTNFTQATTTTTASGFIVLTNTTALRITASFSEADAAKILAGQDASFTFDALPSVSATGKVLQVDILPTTSGGVTSYGATFSVDGKVSGLKVGMTATATVLTGSATGVLQVSAQAVTTRGGATFVNVVTTKNGKQVETITPVVVGLKGDSADEIQSGLKAGDKVALPTVKATTGTNGFAIGGVPGGVGALAGAGLGGGGGFARGNG